MTIHIYYSDDESGSNSTLGQGYFSQHNDWRIGNSNTNNHRDYNDSVVDNQLVFKFAGWVEQQPDYANTTYDQYKYKMVDINGAQVDFGGTITARGSDGKLYNVHSNNDGTFSVDKSQLAGLKFGEHVTIDFQYYVYNTDGSVRTNGLEGTPWFGHHYGYAHVEIFGTDNQGPNANDVFRQEDEDGLAGNAWNDTIVNNQIKFKLDASDPEGDHLYYGMPSSVTVNGRTFTLTNNQDGTVSLDKSQFQFLKAGEKVTLKFTYGVEDGSNPAEVGEATFVIHGLNDAPLVNPVVFSDNEDGTLTQNDGVINFKLPTATDVDGTIVKYALTGAGIQPTTSPNNFTAVGSDGKTYNLTVNPATGEVVFDKNQFQSLQNGRNVVFNFGYTATDDSGATSSSTATITIKGVNDAPIDADENLGTVEYNAANFPVNLVANTTDVDAGDTATIKSIDSVLVNGVPAPGPITNYVTFVDGIATIIPGAFNVPNGEVYKVVINYTIQDSQGATDASKVTLDITHTNLPPVVAFTCEMDNEDGTELANTGDATNIRFKFNAYDPENPNDPTALTFKLSGSAVVSQNGNTYQLKGTDGNVYTAVINNDGTISFDKSQFQYMNIDSKLLEFNVTYTATDKLGASASAEACFQITGLNDAPIDGDESYGVQSVLNGKFSMNLIANTTDIDAGDTATIKSIDKLYVNGIEYSKSVLGTYVKFVGGVATLDSELLAKDLGLKPGGSLSIQIDYTIQDKFGATDTSKATLTLKDPRTPVDAKDVSYTDDEDGTGVDEIKGEENGFTFSFNATGPNAINYTTPASVTIDGRIVSIINNGNGTFSLDAKDLQWMNPDMVRTVQFNYTATDSVTGQSDIATAKVVIQGLNDAPVDGDEALGTVSTKAGAQTVNLLANSYDIDSGDIVSFKQIDSILVNGVPVSGPISDYVKVVNGVATIIPGAFNVPMGATYPVTINYTVTDKYGVTDKSKVTLDLRNETIIKSNDVSYTDNEDGTGVDEIKPGEENGFKFLFNVTNPTGAVLTYTTPASVTIDGRVVKIINNNDGSFELDAKDLQWMNPDMQRNVTFTYTAKDPITGQTSSATANVLIQGLNDAPVDGDEALGTVSTKAANPVVNLLSNSYDIDSGDVVSFKQIDSILVNGVPVSGPISDYVKVVNGVATIIPGAFNVPMGATYPVTINYTVTDKYGVTDKSKVTLDLRNETIIKSNDVSYTDNEDGTGVDEIKPGEENGFKFLFNVTNPTGAVLTYTTPASVTIDGRVVKIINNNDGSFELDAKDLQWMNPDMQRNVTFTYTAKDPITGQTSSATANVLIQGLNDAPVDGDEALGTVSTKAANPVVNLLSNSYDIDSGDVVSFKQIDSILVNGVPVSGPISDYVKVVNGVATIIPGAFNVPMGATYPVTINYTATDKYGVTDKSKVTLDLRNETIIKSNDVSYTDNEDGTGVDEIKPGEENGFKFLFNVTNPTGAVLTYTTPASVTIDGRVVKIINNNDGSFELDAKDLQWMNPDMQRNVTFTYTAKDPITGQTSSATANVLIQGLNDAPVDGDEALGTVSTKAANPVVNLLSNSYDIDSGDVVSFKQIDSILVNGVPVSGPISDYVKVVNGVATIIPGAFNVPMGATYPVTINYTVTDKYGVTDKSKVTLDLRNETIIKSNDVSYTDDEDGAGVDEIKGEENGFKFLFNVTNPTGAVLTYTTPASVTIDGRVVKIINNNDGSFELDAKDLQWMNPDMQRNVTFTYTAKDPITGQTSSATANVLIQGLNDAPVDGDEALGTVSTKAANPVVNLLSNSYDIDSGDVVSFKQIDSILVNGVPVSGPISDYVKVVNGVATIIPGAFNVPMGATYPVTINYTVTDKYGVTDKSKVTLDLRNETIIKSNDVSYTDNEDGTGVDEIKPGEENGFKFLFNVTNPTGAVLTYTTPASVTIDGRVVKIINNNDGSFELDAKDLQWMNPDMQRNVTFTYTAKDPITGQTSSATANVLIQGLNDAPVDGDEALGTVSTKAANPVVNLLSNSYDIDSGDVVSFKQIDSITVNGTTYYGNDIAQFISSINGGNLTLKLSGFNVPANTTYPVTINYTVTDKYGVTDTSKVTLDVKNPDVQITPKDMVLTDNEDGTDVDTGDFELTGFKFKFDISNPSNLPITSISTPASVTIDGHVVKIINNNDGTFNLDAADLQWMNEGTTKDVNFTYSVTTQYGTVSANAKVVITGLNDAPIDGDESYGVQSVVNGNFSMNLVANTTDVDEGDTATIKSIDKLFVNGIEYSSSVLGNYVKFVGGVATLDTALLASDLGLKPGESWPIQINYTIQDKFGATDTSKATLTLTDPRGPVVAQNVDYTDTEDDTGIDNIDGELANFTFAFKVSNPSNFALTYSAPASVTIDGHTVKIINNNNGTFSLDTADLQWMSEGLVRNLTFDYKVTSPFGSSTAKATVVLTGINDAPDAKDDGGYTVKEGGSITVDVLANDTDIDVNDVLSIKDIKSIKIGNGTVITDQSIIDDYVTIVNGKVVFNAAGNGTNKIIVPSGTTVPVEIVYTARDIVGATDTAKININVANNDNPIIYQNSCVQTEDASNPTPINYTGKIEYQLSAVDPNNDKLTYVLVQNNAAYPVTLDPATGKFTVDAGPFQYLTPGQKVDFFIQVKVVDEYGNESDTISQKVTVTGVNDAPIDADEDYGTIKSDAEPFDMNLVANTTDIDNPDAATIKSIDSIIVNGAPVTGPITDYVTFVNGVATLKPGAFNVPNGQTYTVTINYTIQDSFGATDTSKAVIRINDVNTPPDAVDDNYGPIDVSTYGSYVEMTPLSNDKDPDGDPVTIKSYDRIVIKDATGAPVLLLDSTNPADIQKYFYFSGLSGENPELMLDKLNVPIEGKYTVELYYTIQDPSGATDSAKISAVLINPDKAPDAVNDGVFNVVEGTKYVIDVLDNDTDPNTPQGDSISIVPNGFSDLVINGVPVSNSQIPNFIKIINGKVEFDASTLNVNPGENIPVSFKYTITDEYGKTDSATVTLNITDNNSVTAKNITYTDNEDANGVDEISGELTGMKYSFQVNNPAGHGVQYIAPSFGTFADGTKLNIINNGDGTFSLDPNEVKTKLNSMYEGQTKDFTFTYQVKDVDTGVVTTANGKIVFTGINDKPTANNDTATTNESSPVVINVLANDTDPDTQDPSNPLYVTKVYKIVIDGNEITDTNIINQYITYLNTSSLGSKQIQFNTPNFGLTSAQSKLIEIYYTARDKQGLTDNAKVNLTVKGVDEPIINKALDANDAGYKITTSLADADNTFTSTTSTIFNKTVNYAGTTQQGNNNNDTILGDIRNYKVQVTAGNADALVKNSFSGNAHAESDASFINNKINFGADTIDGRFGNDKIVGDIDNLLLAAKQGNAKAVIDYLTCGGNPNAYASANAVIQNNAFKFGADNLKGGEGNDIVTGDVQNLDISYLSGTRYEDRHNDGAVTNYKNYGITGNTFTFGNDSIEGGKGNDVLTGDVDHIKYVDQLRTYTVGTDGKYIETLSAPTTLDFDITDKASFDAFKNSKVFTNNTFKFGADTFVFDASSSFGNDKIKDFSVNGVADKIKLVNLIDANGDTVKNFSDLELLTKVVNDGTGKVKLQIDTNKDGSFDSSITFLNKAFDGDTTIGHYFTASDFII